MTTIDYSTYSEDRLRGIIEAKGKDPSGWSKDRMVGYLESGNGAKLNINFSSPVFNLVAAIVVIIMAGFPGTQFWGALIAIVVLVVDVVRSVRKAKAAGKTRKDWQEVTKDILVEIFAVIAIALAVMVTDMLLLLFGAGMLLADSVTELKKS